MWAIDLPTKIRCSATLKSKVIRIYTLSGCHLTSLHPGVSLNVIAARDTTRTLPTSLHGDGEVQQKWHWAAEKEQIGGWWCSTCSRAGRETRRRARRSPGSSSSSPAAAPDTSRKVVWRRPTVVIVRPGVAAPPLQQAGHQHPQQPQRSLLPGKTIWYSVVIVIPVIVQLLSAVAGSRFVNFHETFG